MYAAHAFILQLKHGNNPMATFCYNRPLVLENGKELPGLEIAYQTYGTLNESRNNVIWICHALTANADVTDWWKGLVGEHCLIDPGKYFIVCANIIGSCYGSTGPTNVNPATGKVYYSDFPQVTIRDMVAAHILLRKHLGIDSIYLLMGGSMGGYQVLEWAVMEPAVMQKIFLIATSPSESAWGVAVHTAQRLAIEADQSWKDHSPTAGARGLKAARAIGMLTYRNYTTFQEKQTDPDPEKIDNFKASSYLNYQGDKLVNRFNAYSYWLLTKAMDSHHLGRGRGGNLMEVLKTIQQPTFIIGINSDILCPLDEQQFMADYMPHAELYAIDSTYGHDGFIIETQQITDLLKDWI
ncbi:MAG: homoserine O-acetyltransferase [Sediminibacterium sp.]|nr:homoserine O-acetyltransferase [Sediminibacterium sp.]